MTNKVRETFGDIVDTLLDEKNNLYCDLFRRDSGDERHCSDGCLFCHGIYHDGCVLYDAKVLLEKLEGEESNINNEISYGVCTPRTLKMAMSLIAERYSGGPLRITVTVPSPGTVDFDESHRIIEDEHDIYNKNERNASSQCSNCAQYAPNTTGTCLESEAIVRDDDTCSGWRWK